MTPWRLTYACVVVVAMGGCGADRRDHGESLDAVLARASGDATWAENKRRLTGIDPEDREDALGDLVRHDEQKSLPILVALLADDTLQLSAAAEVKLRSRLARNSAALTPLLRDLLADSRPGATVQAAAHVLAHHGPSACQVRGQLLRCARTRDTVTARYCTRALAAIGDAAAADLIALLRERPEELDGTIVDELRAMSASVVPQVANACEDRDPRVQNAALVVLYGFGARAASAIGPVRKSLGADDVQVRWAAVVTLHRIGGASDEVGDALRSALKDESALVRAVAAAYLGDFTRWTDVEDDLRRAATADPNSDVRLAAARSIWKGTGDSELAIDVCGRVLRSGRDEAGIEYALMLIREMGPLAWTLQREVETLLADLPYDRLKTGATEALDAIRR